MLCFLGTLYGIIVPKGKTINVSLLLSTPLRQWSSHSETHLKKSGIAFFVVDIERIILAVHSLLFHFDNLRF